MYAFDNLSFVQPRKWINTERAVYKFEFSIFRRKTPRRGDNEF